MPGLSIHVVDVSRGVVATGLRVKVHHGDGRLLAEGIINATGVLDSPALAQRFESGAFKVDFHIADYYRAQGVPLPVVPFLSVVSYDFGIADSQQHYHLPFKMTPWGYSCFRGGA